MAFELTAEYDVSPVRVSVRYKSFKVGIEVIGGRNDAAFRDTLGRYVMAMVRG